MLAVGCYNIQSFIRMFEFMRYVLFCIQLNLCKNSNYVKLMFSVFAAAFDFVYDQATSGDLEQTVGARSDDINFLCDVLGNPIFAELVQVSGSSFRHL